VKRSNTSKQRGKTTFSDVNVLRQFYAEELRAVANLQSEAVVTTFAKVPREHFLGPGPWQVFSPGSESDWTTKNHILKVNQKPEGFTASFISEVRIFPCVGGRDAELNQRLKEAFDRDDWKSVQSLRREPHDPADSCWLHSRDFCLSKLSVMNE
jgi:hypothetical protein